MKMLAWSEVLLPAPVIETIGKILNRGHPDLCAGQP